MLLCLLAITAAFLGLLGFEAAAAASTAKTQLANGEFLESPKFVILAGEPFRLRRPVTAGRLSRYRSVSDSLRAAGVPTYTIGQYAEETGDVERAYFVSSRAELDSDRKRCAWGWAMLMFAGVELLFAFWALWVWLGARARHVDGPA